jgi:hypothetical protein
MKVKVLYKIKNVIFREVDSTYHLGLCQAATAEIRLTEWMVVSKLGL